MKLASIRPQELAVVTDDTFVPVGHALAREGAFANFSMIDLIENYDRLRNRIVEVAASTAGEKLDPRRLKAPVERPSKIWAAAGNYRRGSHGLGDARGRGTAATA
ncbi:MAG TPA: hypothetical protein VNO43_02530, partial [Candidatus Eisenbacteria bacterium]|nr:hypothetical protein [Candidatus Eisenbacteria bacterium]